MTDSTVLDQIAERSAATGVVRWHDRRLIAGVARGIAARYDMDPVVVRVGFVVAAFLGSLGIAAYLLAWVLLPDDRGNVPLVQAARHRTASGIALVVIAALSVLGFISGVGDDRGGRLLGFLLLAGLAFLIWRKADSGRRYGGAAGHAPGASAQAGMTPGTTPDAMAASTAPGTIGPAVPTTEVPTSGQGASRSPGDPVVPAAAREMPVITPWGGRDGERLTTYGPGAYPGGHAAAPPAPRVVVPPAAPTPVRLRRRTLGWRAWLLCAGLAVGAYNITRQIAIASDVGTGSAATLGIAVAGILVGLVLVVLGIRGYRTSGIAPTAALIALLTLVSPWAATYVDRGASMGEVAWQPVTVSELAQSYQVGAGEGTLDLTRLSAADLDGKTVRGTVGFGELRVRVPADVRLEVRHDVGLGQLLVRDVGGQQTVWDGAGVRGSESFGHGPTLILDMKVGLGEALVERIAR